MQKDNLILTERQLARKLGLPYSSVRNLRIQKKNATFPNSRADFLPVGDHYELDGSARTRFDA